MSPAAGPQERCLSKSICSAISLLMQRLKPRGVLVEAQGLLPHDQKLSLGTCKISLSVGTILIGYLSGCVFIHAQKSSSLLILNIHPCQLTVSM